MHRWIGVLGLGAMLSSGCGTSVNVEQERNALLDRDREWAQTAKDPEKFLSYFASDASVYQPGMPVVTGTEAIRKTIADMTAAGVVLQWTPASGEVSGAGDMGYTVGSYEATIDGEVEKGKYVTVWKKQAGEWKVTADIFNADSAPAGRHVMVAPNALKWGDSPPGLPAGARMAVVSGDPSKPGPFVLRAQVPTGYRVPPHWHPSVENLTVLSGTIALGMGEKFDPAGMTVLGAGGFATMPATMRHSLLARTAATFQVHGNGPFAINYVNAADDPRK